MWENMHFRVDYMQVKKGSYTEKIMKDIPKKYQVNSKDKNVLRNSVEQEVYKELRVVRKVHYV